MVSLRMEDRGLTLRLFQNKADIEGAPGLNSPTAYAFGWLAKDDAGRWTDAAGTLPQDWQPKAENLVRI